MDLTNAQIEHNIGISMLEAATGLAKQIHATLTNGREVGVPPKPRLVTGAAIRAKLGAEQAMALENMVDLFLTSKEKAEMQPTAQPKRDRKNRRA